MKKKWYVPEDDVNIGVWAFTALVAGLIGSALLLTFAAKLAGFI